MLHVTSNGFLTDKIVEPRLQGSTPIDGDTEDLPKMDELTDLEEEYEEDLRRMWLDPPERAAPARTAGARNVFVPSTLILLPGDRAIQADAPRRGRLHRFFSVVRLAAGVGEELRGRLAPRRPAGDRAPAPPHHEGARPAQGHAAPPLAEIHHPGAHRN